MGHETDEVVGRARAIRDLLQRHGTVRRFLTDLEGGSAPAAETLRYVVELQMGDRLPLPPVYSQYVSTDAEERFVRQACSKLRPTLRKLLEVDLGEAELEQRFLAVLGWHCERVRRGLLKRYSESRSHGLADHTRGGWSASDLDAGDVPDPAKDWFEPILQRRWTPPHTTSLIAVLKLWIDEPYADRSPMTADGELDVEQVASLLGISARDVQRIARFLRKEAPNVSATVPRPFRKVYQRLTEFAATSWGTLADTKLRESLFDLTRDLAFSFGPQNIVADGAKLLSRHELTGAVDLLLKERSTTSLGEQRTVLERQMQRIVQMCAAFEAGDLNRAYDLSVSFALDAARIQHYSSPERLQVLLCYGYLLLCGRAHGAALEVARAVADRCEAIVEARGPAEWDYPCEFETAVTLRRVRTYALVNSLSCRFHRVLTGAPCQRFWVKDYSALLDLVARLKELIAFDPEAITVQEELLVVQAHVVRAAYNRQHARGVGAAERRRWETEHQRQRDELRAVVERHFFDAVLQLPDVPRLLAGAQVGEGCAAERTLEVLAEVLHSYPAALHELQRARLAVVPGFPE